MEFPSTANGNTIRVTLVVLESNRIAVGIKFKTQFRNELINKASIERAKVGTFRPRSFRNRSWQFQRKMGITLAREFRGDYLVEEKIRRCVHFKKLNLRELENLNCMAGSDIIMCRNVLIYFEETFRLELINAFHKLLNPGGMLFLGETESLPHLPEKFELIKCYDAYGYRKLP